MKISVIIPSYKPGDYIWDCLNSLILQTLSKSDFEVIIVLNGCNEPWKSEIESFISLNMSDMNVKFIQTDVGGVSNARNIALDEAIGDFVTFIDDDDFVSSLYLESMINMTKQDVDVVVLSNTVAFDDLSKEIFEYQLSDVYKKFLNKTNLQISSSVRKYFSGPCMKLLPMSCIQGRRYDVRFRNGEDSLFMFLISDKIKSIVFANENAIYYRRYRESSAITTKGLLINRLVNSSKLIKEYFIIAFKYRVNFLFFITRILGTVKSIFITY